MPSNHLILCCPLSSFDIEDLTKKMSSGFDEDSSVGGSSWDLEPNIWAWGSTTAGSRAARKEPECQERVDILSRDKIHKIVGHGPVQQVPGDVGRLAPSILQFWGLMGRIILKVSKMRGLFILFTKVLFLYANYWFNHLAAARLETPAMILCPHHLTISEQ